MGHEIHLEKYNIRTDLTLEKEYKFANQKEEKWDNIKVTTIDLTSAEAKKIGKKKGQYITIEFDDVTDFENGEKVKEIFANKIRELINYLNIKDDDSCLIAGLGNSKSTPDALGPKAIDNVLVTRHLFILSEIEEGFRCVSAIKPSVMGITGLEASDILKAIIKEHNFKFLIVIDSLASSSINRVNKTIQITDAGINPGSGIGNNRKEINSEVIGIPVIAVGIPTVVDAATIVSDTINYMYKKYTYEKQNINKPFNKLSIGSSNYLKRNIKIDENDKKQLFGIVGTLNNNEVYNLINEVLNPTNYNLIVTPKDIDFQIDKLGMIIGNGLNKALHKKAK